MFGNGGVGRTQQLPGPVTIQEMADQTSALIGTLGLGKPDVRGWSMGGLIAQALAVLHPCPGAPPGAVRHLSRQRPGGRALGHGKAGRQRFSR